MMSPEDNSMMGQNNSNWANNKNNSEDWLRLKKRPRAPKIGLLPRYAAIDEDDPKAMPICDKTTTASNNQHNLDNHSSNNISPRVNINPRAASNGPVPEGSKMISSFVSVIEDTKGLTINEEKQRSPKHVRPESEPEVQQEQQSNLVHVVDQVPLPGKCSTQLRKLLHSHSSTKPPNGSFDTTNIHPSKQKRSESESYSPYGSPTSSPRVRRKPLRETTRVNSTIQSDGEYVQLNQYKLEQGAIGQGSYGIVKLAYNKDDDVQYAMKILSKKKLKRKAGIFGRRLPNRKGPGGSERKQSEDPLTKVYREIAIMKKLDHPNVCKLVEVLDDPEEDNLYMVFELLKEGEVLVVPTDTPMTEKEAWLAFRDVVHGLEYLHYQKIIHRDLKPSNLLRADSGEVKIADLGVSNEFDGHDAFLTNTAGTPAFTPPESISHKPGDEPYSGRMADIWSLGVTLFSLVFGKVPFHDENILALYNKIRTHDLSIPEEPDISPELKDLMRRMLVKKASERITLRDIKEHDWVTGYGLYPMASEVDNCRDLVEVTDKEVQDSIQTVPKLDTLILVKSMIKNHSFSNPFNAAKERFKRDGRSNSAPEAYEILNDGKIIEDPDPNLPALNEDRNEDE